MKTIRLEVPERIGRQVAQAVKRGEFKSDQAYICALIEQDIQQQKELEDALLEGLNSGESRELTEQDWAEFRARSRKSSKKGKNKR
jgi:Arc/MetJ-type ribon-helix-helix transcriptional regulator